jgi:hypothetical protein
VFRRRRGSKDEDAEDLEGAANAEGTGSGDDADFDEDAEIEGNDTESGAAVESGGAGSGAVAGATYDRSRGPWDLSELREGATSDRNAADDDNVDDDDLDDGADDLDDDDDDADDADDDGATAGAPTLRSPHIDFGCLRVHPQEGMQVRVEMDEPTGQVRAITILDGNSALHLQPCAAPRTEGMWDEIIRGLASDATQHGGTATEYVGEFGRELKVSLPVRAKDGRTGTQITRIVGVDGPRWTLRGTFMGKAADPAHAQRLENVFRSTVVVRGAAPMAPGDPLPLAMPTGAVRAEEAEDSDRPPPMAPPERGPEITEIH